MNKQEILTQLKATEVLKTNQAQEAMFTSVKREVHSAEVKLIAEIIELVEKCLDEQQTVKVPAFVAEWIETCKKYGSIVDLLDGTLDIKDEPDQQFFNWVNNNDNADFLARAWLDGYEVEKATKWKILNDRNYCLTSIEAGYGKSMRWAFDSSKEKPILFDNEEIALYTAYITGGTVEPVEVE